jgi:hypothetical protein
MVPPEGISSRIFLIRPKICGIKNADTAIENWISALILKGLRIYLAFAPAYHDPKPSPAINAAITVVIA